MVKRKDNLEYSKGGYPFYNECRMLTFGGNKKRAIA